MTRPPTTALSWIGVVDEMTDDEFRTQFYIGPTKSTSEDAGEMVVYMTEDKIEVVSVNVRPPSIVGGWRVPVAPITANDGRTVAPHVTRSWGRASRSRRVATTSGSRSSPARPTSGDDADPHLEPDRLVARLIRALRRALRGSGP